MPGVPGFDGWSLWRRGLITAVNVTWSADASDPNAQQNYILSQLAVNKGYNAIRLVLSAGSSDAAWDDMYTIATNVDGWNSSVTLTQGGQPISEIRDNITKILVKCAQLGIGVILDCHDFFQRNQSSGAIGPLWQGSSVSSGASSGKTATQLRQALQDFWTKTVTLWGGSNWSAVWSGAGQTSAAPGYPVIGYEILNEPNPDPNLSFADMQAGADNNWWALADSCIKAIRALDASTPIVVDSIYYGDAYGMRYFDAAYAGAPGLLPDYDGSGVAVSADSRRIVYSFHCYGPQEFTHQGVTPELYASLGTPYPLPSSARVITTLYDGTQPTGSTAITTYLPFRDISDLQVRIQPALNFAAANSGVPIFLGEFSAIDPALLRSDHVSTSHASRAITRIAVDASGNATVTLQNAPSITLYPYGSGNGAYTDYALATIESATDSAYNHASTAVRIEGGNPLTMQAGGAPGAFQYTGLNSTTLGNGSAQVATLTLAPSASSATIDAARVQYCQDVVALCIGNRLSWAYWQEDGYEADASTINNAAYSGVFIGWRPSAALSSLLTLAATRRTVSS
jgi:hypothetical protein